MKTINKILFVLLLLTSQKLFSQTTEWTYMYDWGKNGEYSEYFDLSSLDYKCNYIEVWTKQVYNNEENSIEYCVNLNRIYCGERKILTVKDIFYYRNGKVEDLSNPNGIKDYGKIIPETWRDKFYLFFCFK